MRKIVSIGLSFIMLLGAFCALTACEDEGNDTANATSSQSSEKENTVSDKTQTSSDQGENVPNVVDLTQKEAEKKLTDAGYKVEVTEAFSNIYAVGRVISQSLLSDGLTVEISVSKERALIKVPDVKGKTLAKAEETLRNAGFIVKSDIKCSNSVKEGNIISQDIKAGESVTEGSLVTVYVSAGKANTVGNTNQNNLNFNNVIVQGDWVYYNNINKSYGLYKMRKDGTDCQKILDRCSSFNVLGEWIFYSSSSEGLYKIKLDGSQKTKISDFYAEWLYVTEDWIYYAAWRYKSPIYRMKHDGSANMTVTDDKCNYANVVGDYIYYLDESRTGIYRINTDGTMKIKLVTYHNLYFLMYDNKRLYASNNHDNIVVFTEDGTRVSNHVAGGTQILPCNVQDGWLYYLEYDHSKEGVTYLCRAKTDLTEKSVIHIHGENGSDTNFFVQYNDGWVYFPEGESLYRVNVKTHKVENLSW